MIDDDPTPSDLEAEIAAERSALAESLSDLTRQLSPENLVNAIGDTLRDQSEDLAHAVVKGVRENPVALGLMGAGLAWLMLGNKVTGDGDPRPAEPGRVEKTRRFLSDSAAEMRDTIYEGTSELSDIARDRVIQAREKAIAAQEKIEVASHRALRRGHSFYEENPLIVAVGLAAAGAALAAALPRTEAENRAFGARRDALVEEAERIWYDEVARAKAAGRAALDEMRVMADEAVEDIPSGEEAVDLAEEKLRDAGERIRSRAADAHAK